MRSPLPFPSAEEGLEIHSRLCAGDPTASADLCERYLEPLLAALRHRNPNVDEQLLITAAGDTLLALIRNPESYDPSRLTLEAYSVMAAHRDLLNEIRGEKRHQKKREQIPVEDVESVGNTLREDPSHQLERDEERSRLLAELETVSEHWTDAEKRVFEAMRDGESETSVFAAILGVAHLGFDEQQREVKKVKDRITVRLKRSRTESETDG